MPHTGSQALAKSGIKRAPSRGVQRGVVRRPKNSRPAPARGARVVRNKKAR